MATLSYIDGFEHGLATTGSGGIYSTSNAAISTAIKRTGLRSLEISAAAASEEVRYTIASEYACAAFYIYFDNLPTSGVNVLHRFINTSGGSNFALSASTGKFVFDIGASVDTDTGFTPAADTWYRVVHEVSQAGGVATVKVWIDNNSPVSQTSTQTAANFTSSALGTPSAQTYTAYFDDWIISQTAGDSTEIVGWGGHSVVNLIPTADGTHNGFASGNFDSNTTTAFTTSTTNGYTFIAHRPLQAAATANQSIRQDVTGTTHYMEFTLENLPGGTDAVEAVRSYGGFVESSGTGDSLARGKLFLADGTTEVLAVGSLSMLATTASVPGTTVTVQKSMAIDPSGGWDRTKVDGLKLRIGYSDASPIPTFFDFMLDVLLVPTAAANTATVASTLPALTQAAAATTGPNSATVANTLPALTQAATGTSTVVSTATVASTLPALTQAATGTSTEVTTGTVTSTLPALTQSATAISGTVVSTTVTWETARTGQYMLGTYRATTPGVPVVEVKKGTATSTANATIAVTWDGGGTATSGNRLVAMCLRRNGTADTSYVATGWASKGSGFGAILDKVSDGSETGITVTAGASADFRVVLYELANCGTWDTQHRGNFTSSVTSRLLQSTDAIDVADEWAGALVTWSAAITGGTAVWDSDFTEYFEDTTSTAASKIIPTVAENTATVASTLPVLTQAMTANQRTVTDWSDPASDTTFPSAVQTQLIVVTAGV